MERKWLNYGEIFKAIQYLNQEEFDNDPPVDYRPSGENEVRIWQKSGKSAKYKLVFTKTIGGE